MKKRAKLFFSLIIFSILAIIFINLVSADCLKKNCSTVGVYDPLNSFFYLKNSNTEGNPDFNFKFSDSGKNRIAISGDWDGDGVTTTGLYESGTGRFMLKNSNSQGNPDIIFSYGPVGIPVTGDWNGDGKTEIGIYLSQSVDVNGVPMNFFLKNNNNPNDGSGNGFSYGTGGIPITGDWDGDGKTTVGIFNSAIGGFYLRNFNTAGNTDIYFQYYGTGIPVTGDWNGDGKTEVGVYVTKPITVNGIRMNFLLKNNNNPNDGSGNGFLFGGNSTFTPVTGYWGGIKNSSKQEYQSNPSVISKNTSEEKIISQEISKPLNKEVSDTTIKDTSVKNRDGSGTIIFAGVYSWKVKDYFDYMNKLSINIKGLSICCNNQKRNESIVKSYHKQGFTVMTHVGSVNEAIQAAKDNIDIIILDELKMNKVDLDGQGFNQLKDLIKTINPNAKLGIVEPSAKEYRSWFYEWADPDYIGLERYVDKNGQSSYPSYDEFNLLIRPMFPNAKTQVWINSVPQIKEYFGKFDSMILFYMDGLKLGMLSEKDNWPAFELADIEKAIAIERGQPQFQYSYAPSLVNKGANFVIKCDYGINNLPCVSAGFAGGTCSFLRYDGTTAIFNCKAESVGKKKIYCYIFKADDFRCITPRTDKIKEINVLEKTTPVKVCNNNGICDSAETKTNCINDCECDMSSDCPKNNICSFGKCIKSTSCNLMGKVLNFLKIKDC